MFTKNIKSVIASIMQLYRIIRCENVNTESVYDRRWILFMQLMKDLQEIREIFFRNDIDKSFLKLYTIFTKKNIK